MIHKELITLHFFILLLSKIGNLKHIAFKSFSLKYLFLADNNRDLPLILKTITFLIKDLLHIKW
jgi:hypothetical protein